MVSFLLMFRSTLCRRLMDALTFLPLVTQLSFARTPSTTLHPWGEWYFFSFTEQSVLLLGFSAAALAPVAVKFDSSLAGFFAVVSMFYCAPFTLPPTAW